MCIDHISGPDLVAPSGEANEVSSTKWETELRVGLWLATASSFSKSAAPPHPILAKPSLMFDTSFFVVFKVKGAVNQSDTRWQPPLPGRLAESV